MIYTVGHPAAAITEAVTTCDVDLVDVKGAPIDKLVSENSFIEWLPSRVVCMLGMIRRQRPSVLQQP